MARMPVEIIPIGGAHLRDIDEAITIANSSQDEFAYTRLAADDERRFNVYAFRRIVADELLNVIEQERDRLRGYHPFLLAITDAYLDGDRYTNLFGDSRGDNGIGVLTIANVPDVIIPSDRIVAYFVYYFARYTLRYIVPAHTNHDDCRSCVYDRKVEKLDLLKSMRARAMSDDCRRRLLSAESKLSPSQFMALDSLFDMSGRLLTADASRQPAADNAGRPRVFIGSSTEGLQLAHVIQTLLEYDVDAEIWNQGTVFGLGDATLEALERAVLEYDFGIFVFTPDDELNSRDQIRPVARDNVVFELGLFVGKLTRRRAFVVHPFGKSITLPSDLAGLTTATYDPSKTNLTAALGPTVQRIREAVQRVRRET